MSALDPTETEIIDAIFANAIKPYDAMLQILKYVGFLENFHALDELLAREVHAFNVAGNRSKDVDVFKVRCDNIRMAKSRYLEIARNGLLDELRAEAAIAIGAVTPIDLDNPRIMIPSAMWSILDLNTRTGIARGGDVECRDVRVFRLYPPTVQRS